MKQHNDPEDRGGDKHGNGGWGETVEEASSESASEVCDPASGRKPAVRRACQRTRATDPAADDSEEGVRHDDGADPRDANLLNRRSLEAHGHSGDKRTELGGQTEEQGHSANKQHRTGDCQDATDRSRPTGRRLTQERASARGTETESDQNERGQPSTVDLDSGHCQGEHDGIAGHVRRENPVRHETRRIDTARRYRDEENRIR